jgi:lysophospholipase L1-like esterase
MGRRCISLFPVLALCLHGCAHQSQIAARPPEVLPASCAANPIHVTFLGDSLAKGWGARDARNTFTSRVFSFAGTAAEYRAATVDLYRLSIREASRKNALLATDGIHPNDDGYKLMAEAAYPVVQRMIGFNGSGRK